MMAKEGAIPIDEPNYRYDVFISFRGADTSRTFAANLSNALRLKRFKIFEEESRLQEVDQISSSIHEALQESRIYIVVLSENYAASSWCLDELVQILDCRKEKNKLVLPIFYNVDPSHLRLQRGSYAPAMAKHEPRFGNDYEKVQRWRSALSEVANITGWLFKTGQQYEDELIQKIVERLTEFESTLTPSYNVFLSFSGRDSGNSFTSFLYNALEHDGFKTFMNDGGLEDGDQIPRSLIKVIEGSEFLIIVLSENYAKSSSSLDQLVRILDSRKMKNQFVWPIFYKVEPTEVRHQKNSYCDAMEAHESRLGKYSEKVLRWRLALHEVANLKGWSLKTRYEYKLIEEIMAIMKLPPANYDVFVSFSGIDTRQGIVGNLYKSLELRSIKTFMDDGELKSGDQMSRSLSIAALEGSRISIVVLSKDYASSTWCLDKLVMIIECMKLNNRLVLPIFCGVGPSDVRRQEGTYGKAMEAHENTFGVDSEKVRQWRLALSQVANIKGWQLNTGNGNEFVERIVEVAFEFLSIDVFLSFTGDDTRRSFTGFLYNALRQEGLKTFMDDEGLKGGDEISQTLTKTIEQSRLSIIVFSENYASSTWCLDELVMIIERMKLKKQLVFPIFYKVEKSDVSYQKKSYAKAMVEHGNMFGSDSKKVQRWRSALSEAANLEGEHIKENESEYEFIKKIVGMVRALLSTDKDLSFEPKTKKIKT